MAPADRKLKLKVTIYDGLGAQKAQAKRGTWN